MNLVRNLSEIPSQLPSIRDTLDTSHTKPGHCTGSEKAKVYPQRRLSMAATGEVVHEVLPLPAN